MLRFPVTSVAQALSHANPSGVWALTMTTVPGFTCT